MKLIDLFENNAVKNDSQTVYISLGGSWDTDDGGEDYANGNYAVDFPSKESADKFLADQQAIEAAFEDGTILIDRFEQDGWEPQNADGHAHTIHFISASAKKPSGTIMKNLYTMVYFLRDAGFLDADYAKQIAKTS